MEDAEALLRGGGDHFGVARGVAIGGRQLNVRPKGLTQPPHFFLPPAVGPDEAAQNAILGVKRHMGADQGLCAQTTGEGGDRVLGRGP